MNPIRLAIITVSDGVSAGARQDRSGAAIADWAERAGHIVAARDTLPDEGERIAAALLRHTDDGSIDLVITTGGTGFTERDVTPEATAAVIERMAPGIAEAIRARAAGVTPFALLSRGLSGIRGHTLIVNLPGSKGGVRDGLAVLDEVVGHAVQLLRGIDTSRHDRPADG